MKKGRKRIQSTKRMMCRTDTCNGGETHGGFVLIMDHTCAAPEEGAESGEQPGKAAEEARCEDWVGETRGEMEKERERQKGEGRPSFFAPDPTRLNKPTTPTAITAATADAPRLALRCTMSMSLQYSPGGMSQLRKHLKQSAAGHWVESPLWVSVTLLWSTCQSSSPL